MGGWRLGPPHPPGLKKTHPGDPIWYGGSYFIGDMKGGLFDKILEAAPRCIEQECGQLKEMKQDRSRRGFSKPLAGVYKAAAL